MNFRHLSAFGNLAKTRVKVESCFVVLPPNIRGLRRSSLDLTQGLPHSPPFIKDHQLLSTLLT